MRLWATHNDFQVILELLFDYFETWGYGSNRVDCFFMIKSIANDFWINIIHVLAPSIQKFRLYFI